MPVTKKTKNPDTAKPFALVSGAREAYLNFLRNMTPAILLITMLTIAGVKLSHKVEFLGVVAVVGLVIAVLLSIWNNSMQLLDKIKEAYEVKKAGDLPFKGSFEFAVVALLIPVAFTVILFMGVSSADQMLKKDKTTQQVAPKQEGAPVSPTTKSKPAP